MDEVSVLEMLSNTPRRTANSLQIVPKKAPDNQPSFSPTANTNTVPPAKRPPGCHFCYLRIGTVQPFELTDSPGELTIDGTHSLSFKWGNGEKKSEMMIDCNHITSAWPYFDDANEGAFLVFGYDENPIYSAKLPAKYWNHSDPMFDVRSITIQSSPEQRAGLTTLWVHLLDKGFIPASKKHLIPKVAKKKSSQVAEAIKKGTLANFSSEDRIREEASPIPKYKDIANAVPSPALSDLSSRSPPPFALPSSSPARPLASPNRALAAANTSSSSSSGAFSALSSSKAAPNLATTISSSSSALAARPVAAPSSSSSAPVKRSFGIASLPQFGGGQAKTSPKPATPTGPSPSAATLYGDPNMVAPSHLRDFRAPTLKRASAAAPSSSSSSSSAGAPKSLTSGFVKPVHGRPLTTSPERVPGPIKEKVTRQRLRDFDDEENEADSEEEEDGDQPNLGYDGWAPQEKPKKPTKAAATRTTKSQKSWDSSPLGVGAGRGIVGKSPSAKGNEATSSSSSSSALAAPEPQLECDKVSLDGIDLTQADLKRCQPNEFLNDNIIDFYIAFLTRRLAGAAEIVPLNGSIALFNTHFYKLLQRDVEDCAQRWNRKDILTDKKFLLIPVNEHSHWKLVIVYNYPALVQQMEAEIAEKSDKSKKPIQTRSLTPSESPAGAVVDGANPPKKKRRLLNTLSQETGEDSVFAWPRTRPPTPPPPSPLEETTSPTPRKSSASASPSASADPHAGGKCHIYLLNSLASPDREYAKTIKQFLKARMVFEKKWAAHQDLIEQRVDRIPVAAMKVPQQKNYSDCGVFVLHYIELFVLAPFLMAFEENPAKRVGHTAWFPGTDIAQKRLFIQSLIQEMDRLQSAHRTAHPLPDRLDRAPSASPTLSQGHRLSDAVVVVGTSSQGRNSMAISESSVTGSAIPPFVLPDAFFAKMDESVRRQLEDFEIATPPTWKLETRLSDIRPFLNNSHNTSHSDLAQNVNNTKDTGKPQTDMASPMDVDAMSDAAASQVSVDMLEEPALVGHIEPPPHLPLKPSPTTTTSSASIDLFPKSSTGDASPIPSPITTRSGRHRTSNGQNLKDQSSPLLNNPGTSASPPSGRQRRGASVASLDILQGSSASLSSMEAPSPHHAKALEHPQKPEASPGEEPTLILSAASSSSSIDGDGLPVARRYARRKPPPPPPPPPVTSPPASIKAMYGLATTEKKPSMGVGESAKETVEESQGGDPDSQGSRRSRRGTKGQNGANLASSVSQETRESTTRRSLAGQQEKVMSSADKSEVIDVEQDEKDNAENVDDEDEEVVIAPTQPTEKPAKPVAAKPPAGVKETEPEQEDSQKRVLRSRQKPQPKR